MSVAVDMDLKFEKYCRVDQSPTTVLPSPWYAKRASRSKKGRASLQIDKVTLEAGFTEIKLRNYHRSVSCKSLPSRNKEPSVDSKVLRRGSVYQCSKERKPLKGLESVDERKKIEFSIGDAPFSFSLLDSICGSDEEEEPLEESSRESSSVNLDNRESSSFRPAERDTMENPEFNSHQVVVPSSNANILRENDTQVLHYSLSSKSRFASIRKMFDPLTKSKSHRSPLSSKLERDDIVSSNKTPQKSSFCELSSTMKNTDCGGEYVKKDCVPGHLHGDLRLEHKHGVPYFELSFSHCEDIFVAKTWKAEDKLNWVYTFHSVQGRKKSSVSGSGIKYSNKESPIIAQMQVSCHLLSELKDGAFSDSMVTEFVLYDITQARKSFMAEESDSASNIGLACKGNFGLDESFDPGLLRVKNMNALEKRSSDFSSPYPWAPADLHPSLETAAVVIQVPLKKRESLKYSSGDTFSHQVKLNLLDVSLAPQKQSGFSDGSGTRVNVVTPMGNHSLPTCESVGPSPLLDKWRLGGGCDCGGWDMACPIVVLSNTNAESKGEHSFMKNDRPFELYVQGAKRKSPALTIQNSGKGQYAIDFHAQLSTLQAFAISVAMLHATEASTRADQEKNAQCNALKAFVEDEVKILIESVTEETTEKEKFRKRVENHPSSFMLNPPFSPISRV